VKNRDTIIWMPADASEYEADPKLYEGQPPLEIPGYPPIDLSAEPIFGKPDSSAAIPAS
jgi:hypothetical protein